MASRDRKSDSARPPRPTSTAASPASSVSPSNPPPNPNTNPGSTAQNRGISSSPSRPLTICARRFGANVRTLRLRQALTQEELAARAHMYRTHISLIELGRRSIRLQTVCVLAAGLGVKPAELMPELIMTPRAE